MIRSLLFYNPTTIEQVNKNDIILISRFINETKSIAIYDVQFVRC